MIPIMNNIEQAIVYSLRSLLTTELNIGFLANGQRWRSQLDDRAVPYKKKWVIVHVTCKWDRFLGFNPLTTGVNNKSTPVILVLLSIYNT